MYMGAYTCIPTWRVRYSESLVRFQHGHRIRLVMPVAVLQGAVDDHNTFGYSWDFIDEQKCRNALDDRATLFRAYTPPCIADIPVPGGKWGRATGESGNVTQAIRSSKVQEKA